MTRAGQVISPAVDAGDSRLLEAKYKIFMESIDIQRRWRSMMDEAAS
jgi:hypothetical protein